VWCLSVNSVVQCVVREREKEREFLLRDSFAFVVTVEKESSWRSDANSKFLESLVVRGQAT